MTCRVRPKEQQSTTDQQSEGRDGVKDGGLAVVVRPRRHRIQLRPAVQQQLHAPRRTAPRGQMQCLRRVGRSEAFVIISPLRSLLLSSSLRSVRCQ